MVAAWAIGCGLLGLIIGSFCNVVIWRVPRGESIVSPPSHCPSCDQPVSPRDNIPVFSWLLLRGRCRHCQTSISARYPLVELAIGVLFALVGARFAETPALLPAYLVFAAAMLVVSVIDLEHFLIPNRIVYPTGIMLVPLFALAAGLEDEWSSFGRALVAAGAAFAVMFVVHVISPRGMGFGDVRLSFLLGLALGFLGWGEVLFGFFCGFLYGSVIGVALIAIRRRNRRQHIPFGPFLAAGALTMVLIGAPILDWYQNLSGS